MVNLFILGVALLAAVILLSRWYVTADPKVLLKSMKWVGFAAATIVLAWLAVTGKLWAVLGALPAMLMWFLRLYTGLRYAQMFKRMVGLGGRSKGWSSPGSRGRANGDRSHVRTRFVDMTLDHETGEVAGEVLEGRFRGQRLDDLTLDEVLDLLAEAQSDEDSARVLESYLDRRAPDWRQQRQGQDDPGDDEQRGEEGRSDRHRARASSTTMSRAEALRVLGLEDGADAQAIKAAHRRLMAQVHPDRGGSDYLAQQINQAKDVLLGD